MSGEADVAIGGPPGARRGKCPPLLSSKRTDSSHGIAAGGRVEGRVEYRHGHGLSSLGRGLHQQEAAGRAALPLPRPPPPPPCSPASANTNRTGRQHSIQSIPIPIPIALALWLVVDSAADQGAGCRSSASSPAPSPMSPATTAAVRSGQWALLYFNPPPVSLFSQSILAFSLSETAPRPAPPPPSASPASYCLSLPFADA